MRTEECWPQGSLTTSPIGTAAVMRYGERDDFGCGSFRLMRNDYAIETWHTPIVERSEEILQRVLYFGSKKRLSTFSDSMYRVTCENSRSCRGSGQPSSQNESNNVPLHRAQNSDRIIQTIHTCIDESGTIYRFQVVSCGILELNSGENELVSLMLLGVA